MSSIQQHYTKNAEVKRMTDIPSTNKQTLQTIYEDVPCHVQPLEDSFSSEDDGIYGKDFLMFCDVRDIKQGDRVIICGIEYKVMSNESYSFLRRTRHMEIRIRVFKNK